MSHRNAQASAGGEAGTANGKLSDLQRWAALHDICSLGFTNIFSILGGQKLCARQSEGLGMNQTWARPHETRSKEERGVHSQPLSARPPEDYVLL